MTLKFNRLIAVVEWTYNFIKLCVLVDYKEKNRQNNKKLSNSAKNNTVAATAKKKEIFYCVLYVKN